ncbi:MAG: toll/interleukin-1 receptor domain-containing protein [Acidobacteriia bacterium]|nr:toll/interleukin-1 receptor domain-containing protein [Terriglobia bacterium]
MAPSPTDYAYDVFFSYKRHDLTLDWTRGVHSRLKYWMMQAVGGREVETFIDDDSIETGDRWPEKLKEALRLSRCMVCIWSPAYFQSSWCVSEWESFRERERRLKMQSHGLIAPLRFHDGEHFPEEARAVQWTDVAPYTSTVPTFWTSPRAIELEDVLKTFAGQVARMIQNAPQFEEDWPVVEAPGHTRGRVGLARL